MAIFGNFGTALEDLITSERQAEFSPIVVEKLYDRLKRDDYGIIIEGVRLGDLSASLVNSPTYNAIPYVTGDACTITSCDISPDYSAKVWDMVMAECRHSLCTRTASRKFMALWGQYKAIRPDDSEYDFLVEQISDILADVLANTLIAKLFLSDVALTSATINGTNGFIAQWKLETANIVNATPLVTDAEDVTGQEWYNIMKAMVEKYQDMPFRKSISEAQFIIDEVAARRIVTFLNNTDQLSAYDCTCVDVDGMVRAGRFQVEGLQILGIPVKTIPYSDMIAAFPDFDDDGAVVDPIFAVLTPKTEVQIGTPKEDELNMQDSFYDKKDRTYYFDIGYQFGAMIPSNNFVLAQAGA